MKTISDEQLDKEYLKIYKNGNDEENDIYHKLRMKIWLNGARWMRNKMKTIKDDRSKEFNSEESELILKALNYQLCDVTEKLITKYDIIKSKSTRNLNDLESKQLVHMKSKITELIQKMKE